MPIDFSEPSVNALRHARELASATKAHLTLLNVVEEHSSFRTLDAAGQRRGRVIERTERLQDLAARELGSKAVADIEVREGSPATEIARLAGQRHADLIVVGGHQHHGIWGWAHGHTAARLSRNAPCPVLVLKAGRLN